MTLDEVTERLIETEQRSKSNTKRLDEHTEQIKTFTDIATSVQVMATEMSHQSASINDIKKNVGELSTKVDTLEQKPAKRWEGAVDKIIYGIIGALVAAAVGAVIKLL